MNYLFKLMPMMVLIPFLLVIVGIYMYYIPLCIAGILILYFLFFFFRVPKKVQLSIHKNPIVSPAFGTIRDIKLSKGYVHITITLSLFDPHVQYVPYNGIIRRKIYKKGEFKPVYFLNKSQYNERMVTIFDTGIGDITVSQIAGMLTRRIHNFARPLQVMRKGDHLGFICFGSRVDILFKNSDKIKLGVSIGDRVRGGETCLAYIYNTK
jgi:phosphatidylserine decarboxylase